MIFLKVLEVGFFTRCVAQNRGATPGQSKRWREGIQVREVMPVQGRLSVERMCQIARVSRVGYYRSYEQQNPVASRMSHDSSHCLKSGVHLCVGLKDAGRGAQKIAKIAKLVLASIENRKQDCRFIRHRASIGTESFIVYA
ncbi:MAG TPA: hypothetical protein VHA06_16710 [Candidatus Angelobacter sp.]|nr:hypothetical protein [Candidatus Angelobacter sp.]